jgi:hypothetical protein
LSCPCTIHPSMDGWMDGYICGCWFTLAHRTRHSNFRNPPPKWEVLKHCNFRGQNLQNFNLKLWKIILCGKFSAFWAGEKKKKKHHHHHWSSEICFLRPWFFTVFLHTFFNFWGSFFGQFPTVLTICYNIVIIWMLDFV